MLADIIVIAILVVIVALVIRTIIKSKKSGQSLQSIPHCRLLPAFFDLII